MGKLRVTKQQMNFICEQLMDGKSLAKICESNQDLPSSRTVTRHLQDSEESYLQYRKARAIQGELLRDTIIELVERPLPEDPKLAQAEVGRRRLEAEQKDKYIRQLQPLGIRDKAEDKNDQVSGTLTLSWE
tara:strand:+ start:1366 stop:1758 length:393 start_codon:yes stop_codon:yes gene_type:complete